MKRIFVMNLKGGVGKTTLANELAYSLDRTNTPYSFFELDAQGGSPHKEELRADAVVQIADTPAAQISELPTWARAADVIVIPVRSSRLDGHAFARTLDTIRANNPTARIIIVQNGWNRYKAAKEFGVWLERHADGAPIFPLAQSEQIVQATAKGKSAIEWAPKRTRVRSQLASIVNAVRAAAGIETESIDT